MAATTLVIVESAAKAKTLNKFLGKNYKIKASVGHIKDMPKSKMGIDIEGDFEPQYITIRGKGEILKEIKKESQKVDRVLLATDPDREGEAIAWHLQNAINIPSETPCRIEFHEITKEAVKQAIKQVRVIDIDRVNAQQARRVLDRLVGYNLSPLLWAKVRKGLSAGRVQSVAVKIICDREREIESFNPQEYWTIETSLSGKSNQKFTARLHSFQGEKLETIDKEAKDRIVQELGRSSFFVSQVDNKERKKTANPPFITSTLQQEASKRLNFFAKRTMRVAQELYEGLSIGKEGTVGLITYLRTDSTRVATVAQDEALDYIRQMFGGSYAPPAPNIYKSRKSAQDAHEAIRPTSVFRTPESVKAFLSRDQYRLYKLIWERFVASQMSAAVYDTYTVKIAAGDYELRASSSKLKFAGYKKVYNDPTEEDDNKNSLPELSINEKLQLIDVLPEQHFTQPPPRFNEASLVKLMEEKNIGRPSTYSPIIDTIIKRGYVERQNKQFVPTELGFLIIDLLKEHFSNILEIEFTAHMEENLDDIEEGKLEWKEVIKDFYQPFSKDLQAAEHLIEKIEIKDEEAGRDCPVCGRPLMIKNGRFGKFIACSGFPECRYTESINEEIGVPCPLCGSPLVALKSKKGRKYFGCKAYPECSFRSWNKPTQEKCPQCGSILVEKPAKSGKKELICHNQDCDFKKVMED